MDEHPTNQPTPTAQPDNQNDTQYLKDRQQTEATIERQVEEYAETKDKDGHEA